MMAKDRPGALPENINKMEAQNYSTSFSPGIKASTYFTYFGYHCGWRFCLFGCQRSARGSQQLGMTSQTSGCRHNLDQWIYKLL